MRTVILKIASKLHIKIEIIIIINNYYVFAAIIK